jgi:hypothetical protein
MENKMNIELALSEDERMTKESREHGEKCLIKLLRGCSLIDYVSNTFLYQTINLMGKEPNSFYNTIEGSNNPQEIYSILTSMGYNIVASRITQDNKPRKK